MNEPMNLTSAKVAQHVRAALRCLDEAQRELDRAAQEICPVRALGNSRDRLRDLYHHVHQAWLNVEARLLAGKRQLDEYARRNP